MMKKSTHDKLNSIGGTAPHFVEPHESFARTKDGASNVETGHPHSNLGKFLHPKKSGYTPNLGKPAAGINKTVDANTGGHKVRHTQ